MLVRKRTRYRLLQKKLTELLTESGKMSFIALHDELIHQPGLREWISRGSIAIALKQIGAIRTFANKVPYWHLPKNPSRIKEE